MRQHSFFPFALLLLFFATACERQSDSGNEAGVNWLVGSWVVDRQKTVQAFQENMLPASGDESAGFAERMAMEALKKSLNATVEKILTPMDKMIFTFTETEYSREAIGFGGEGKPYEILNHPARDQIRIREDSGAVKTYHRQGNNIWYEFHGQEKLVIFLTPTNQPTKSKSAKPSSQ